MRSSNREGRKDEENVSTLKRKESQRSWFSETNVHQGGKKDFEKTASQEEKQIDRPGREMMDRKVAVSRLRKKKFPKKIRISKQHEFRRIIENGNKTEGENLILFRLNGSNEEGQGFGIKMARGIKGAVIRNRIKRVIREFLRKNKDSFTPNEGVVVVCKSKAGAIDLHQLKEELVSLIG